MQIELDMDGIIANSYKNFHTKGLDYLCLKRTPQHTVKYYFFDGAVEKLPEVVNPHNHRYAFHTECISGVVENIWYETSEFGETYNAFNYMTPLNGGKGFTESGEEKLYAHQKRVFLPGQNYRMYPNEIHTINIRKSETIIKLDQFEDRVDKNLPTQTYSLADEAPSLSGLYDQFTEDEVVAKIRILMDMKV